jgi:type II secretory pathway pseudopilin PulG
VLTLKEQRGSGFIEILVALSIFGAIGVVFLNSISTSMMGSATIEEYSAAESIARTQIEYVKSLPYSHDSSYPIIATYSGYDPALEVIDLSPAEYPDTLQKITITVSRNGHSILSLETFKVNR